MVLNIEQIKNKPQFLNNCGGKGSNLFRLRSIGHRVPDFIIIPDNQVHELLGENEKLIEEVLINFNKSTDIDSIQASNEIIEIIKNIEVPTDLLDEIESNFNQNSNSLFAVRSSVNQEDGEKASFAGLFTTTLDVKSQDLQNAIIQCISSLYQSHVLEYCRLKGVNPLENRLSIIIQEMVEASISGVVFTMNPNGNFNDIIISCAIGSGEGVVNNSSEITNYLVCRQNRQNYKEDSEKDILNENQIQELIDRVLEIEKHFGVPQDIEFSFDSEGQLFILQSRPITTIDLKNLKIVDNTNIVESYPGLTLPLSFSFAKNGYRQVFMNAARLFRVSETKIDEIQDELSNMITHVNGRVYYNLHNWYKLMQLVLSNQNSMQAWETLIGVKIKSETKTTLSFFSKIKTSFISLSLFFRYRKIVAKFYSDFDLEYSKLRRYADNLEISKPSSKEVFAFYKQISDRIFVNWAPTIMNDFFTFKFFDFLKKITLSTGFKEEDTITNDLLCGIPGVESEMLIMELLKIKDRILYNEKLELLFEQSEQQILEKMPSDFREILDSFVEKYGDRTLEELKLETPNFRMNPEALIQLIKSQLTNKNTEESIISQQSKIRLEAEERISQKIKSFSFKYLVFGFILKRCREAIRNRENMRLRRTRSYGAVKEMFYYIGKEMQSKGIIVKASDVFYLSLSQLEEYSINEISEDLQKQIAEIKENYLGFESQILPDRMVFNGDFPPVKSRKISQKSTDKIFYGTTISKGKLQAETIVLSKPDYTQSVDGKILVTRMTDPAWVFLMTRAAGLISEKGSPLSHTAIVGRELGIPVLIGIENATVNLPTGTKVLLNCDEGFVEIVD